MEEIAARVPLIRPCGADCSQCETYARFLAGEHGGLVNLETGYRCCWLPPDYPEGQDCPIFACSERHQVTFCGECPEFQHCARMRAFYAQPGYETLRRRMLEAMESQSGSRGDRPGGTTNR